MKKTKVAKGSKASANGVGSGGAGERLPPQPSDWGQRGAEVALPPNYEKNGVINIYISLKRKRQICYPNAAKFRKISLSVLICKLALISYTGP